MSILFYFNIKNVLHLVKNIWHMKNSLLIPNKYKVIGWGVFLAFLIAAIITSKYNYKIPGFQLYYPKDEGIGFGTDFNLTDEVAYVGIFIGLLMVCFSKEKIEDEYINHLRLKAWQWSVLINYIILIGIIFSFYGLSFVFYMTFNSVTMFLVFIVKFNWSLYKLRREGLGDEK